MREEQPLLTAKEVAERLRVHPVTVQRYIREGRFPAARIGKQYLVSEGALQEFLQENVRVIVPVSKGTAKSAKKKKTRKIA